MKTMEDPEKEKDEESEEREEEEECAKMEAVWKKREAMKRRGR